MYIRNLLTVCFCLVIVGCSDKVKPSLSGEEPVEIQDFIDAFELVKPTYEIPDSLLEKKENDSLLVSYKVFTQFIPDSVIVKVFGKNVKPKFYMMKRVDYEKQESYLFAKAVHNNQKVVFVLCFNEKKEFAAAMPLLVSKRSKSTSQVGSIDRRFTITRTTYQKMSDGVVREGKEVYVYNAESNQFILIMTDELDDRITEIINPIDTLNKKHKYAADYTRDKMNIVSIRDAEKPGKINFFIHFDRTNGECVGELKGEAAFVKSNVAVYRQPGDICVLQFTFSSSSVTLKELDPCGTHRGVKCSFDGSYPRKKIAKKKT